MKFVLLLIVLSFSISVIADDKELVQEVGQTLNNISSGKDNLEDCPEAKDHEKLVKACREVGVKKVIDQAQAYGISLKASEVKVCDVDGRFFSVAQYVWFCASSSKGVITQMTQKPIMGKCF